MSGEALTHSHHLDPALDVDAPLAGAVLAGDLTHLGGGTEAAKRPHHELCQGGEAIADAGARVGHRQGPGEGQRALVEDCGASPGQPLDRHIPGAAGEVDRAPVTRLEDVPLAEGDDPPRDVETEALGEPALGGPDQHRSRQGGVEAGLVGKGLPDQSDLSGHGAGA